MVPVQKVYLIVGSVEKLNTCSRPVVPASLQGFADADVIRQPDHQRDGRGNQAKHDQVHLLDVGPRHGLHAAEHRVDGGRDRHQQADGRDVGADHHRQHHGRRRDDGAAGHAAGEQEQQRGERPGFRVEPLLEVLVGGEDPRVVEKRDEGDRDDDHRNRQGVILLEQAHAHRVALAGGADHRDRRQLRRHHRQADGPPRQAAAGEKVAFDLGGVFREPDAVPDDPDEVDGDDRPVDGGHHRVKYHWKAYSADSVTTHTTTTRT